MAAWLSANHMKLAFTYEPADAVTGSDGGH
jgi:hypothetical protein